MANSMHPNNWVAVTPANTTLGYIATSLYIGVGGDVKVKCVGNTTAVTFKNAQSGSYIIGQFDKVYSGGTTATNILAAKLN